MKSSPGITAFNSGELSPSLEGRTEIKQYATGAFAMENLIPMVGGPARRRPGTIHVAEIKDSTKKGALTEFIRSATEAFMLEWGDNSLRFYKNHAPVGVVSQVWNPLVGGTTADGALTWTNRGFVYYFARPAVAALNNVIIDPSGKLQICINAGATFSGTIWNSTTGAITVEFGGAIWRCLGVPVWAALTIFAANAPIYTAQGIQQVTAGGGGSSSAGNTVVPYEISTPYAAADLYDANGFFQLVFSESADVVYVTHRAGNVPVYKLEHRGDTDWTFAPMISVGGPFADQNPGTSPIVFASGETGDNITLTASDDIFDALLVGAYFQLTQQNIRDIKPWESGKQITKRGQRRRYNGVTYEAINGTGSDTGTTALPWTTGTVPPTHVTGVANDGMAAHKVDWEYRDSGYGFVQISARGVDPTGAAVVITGITAAKPPVVTTATPTAAANGDLVFIKGVVGMPEVNDKFYRIAGKAGSTFQLQQDQTGGSPADVDGQNWDAYVSGGTADNRLWTATANVLVQDQAATVNRLPASVVGSQNATSIWAVGAWNARDGFPTAVTFFRGRLAFAKDGHVWLSVAQDFEVFTALTPNAQATADMSVAIQLPTQDEVLWMAEGRILAVGTASAEHSVQELNPQQAFGPSNVSTKKQMKHGSRAVTPLIVDASLIWAQTSGIKLRSMKYDFGSDNYVSQDLNALADTITKTGIIGLAYQQEPDSVVWAFTADGRWIGLTFNETEQVMGWHRHPMALDSMVESVAVIPTMAGGFDELWLIVKRTIGGVTRRYVEYMAGHFLTGDDLATDATYVDSSVRYSGAPVSVMSGLSHLNGETVRVLADGATHPDCVVAGGAITLTRPGSEVVAGLPQVAKLTTMPLLAEPGGTAQGKTKRVINSQFRFLNTMGGEVGNDDTGNLDTLIFRQPEDPMDTALPVFNGIFPADTYSIPWPMGSEQEGKMTYRNSDPLPCTIVAIYPEVDTN